MGIVTRRAPARWNSVRPALWAAALLLGALPLTALPAHAQQGPIPVGVVAAELKPVADAMEFVGRVEAPERVDIRARVKAMLEAVLFKDGETVKEGQPLYRIEPEA